MFQSPKTSLWKVFWAFLISCAIASFCFRFLYKVELEVCLDKEIPQSLLHGVSIVIQEKGHETLSSKDFRVFKCKVPGAATSITIYTDSPGCDNTILEIKVDGKVIKQNIEFKNNYRFTVNRTEDEVNAFFKKRIWLSVFIGFLSFLSVIGICFIPFKISFSPLLIEQLNRCGISLILSLFVFLVVCACVIFTAIFDYSPIRFVINFSPDTVFAQNDSIDILARYHGQEATEEQYNDFFDPAQNYYRQELFSKTSAERILKSNLNEISVAFKTDPKTKYKIASVVLGDETISAEDFIKLYGKKTVMDGDWIQGSSSFAIRTPTDLYRTQRNAIILKGIGLASLLSILVFSIIQIFRKIQERKNYSYKTVLDIACGIPMFLALFALGCLFYCSMKFPAHIDTIVNGIAMYNMTSGNWAYYNSQYFPAFVSTGVILLYPLGVLNHVLHIESFNSPMIAMGIMNYLAIVAMLIFMKIFLIRRWKSFSFASFLFLIFFMGYFPCWFFSQIFGEITAGCFLLVGCTFLYSQNNPNRISLIFSGISLAIAYRIKTITLIPVLSIIGVYIIQEYNFHKVFSKRNVIRNISTLWLLSGFLFILFSYKLFKATVAGSSSLLKQKYIDQGFIEGSLGLLLPLFNWKNLCINLSRTFNLIASRYGLTLYFALLITCSVYLLYLLFDRRFNRHEKFSVCTVISGLGLFIWFIIFSFLSGHAAERHFITGVILAAGGCIVWIVHHGVSLHRHTCVLLCSIILLFCLSTMQKPWTKESYAEGRGWWSYHFQKEKEKEQTIKQAADFLKGNGLFVKFIDIKESPFMYYFPQGRLSGTRSQYEESMKKTPKEELSHSVVISTNRTISSIFQKDYDTNPIFSSDVINVYKYKNTDPPEK